MYGVVAVIGTGILLVWGVGLIVSPTPLAPRVRGASTPAKVPEVPKAESPRSMPSLANDPGATERSTSSAEEVHQAYDPSVTQAWKDGFRPAENLPYDSRISGRVVGPEGPVSNISVFVKWAFSFGPPSKGLRYVSGTGIDEEGVLWSMRSGVTDENGYFQIDGVPIVLLKVQVGWTEIRTYPIPNVHVVVDLQWNK